MFFAVHISNCHISIYPGPNHWTYSIKLSLKYSGNVDKTFNIRCVVGESGLGYYQGRMLGISKLRNWTPIASRGQTTKIPVKIFSTVILLLPIQENWARENHLKSSNAKPPLIIYISSATLIWSIRLQCTIWMLAHNLTHHQQLPSQCNDSTISDITALSSVSRQHSYLLKLFSHHYSLPSSL